MSKVNRRRLVLTGIAVFLIATLPDWGPAMLSHLPLFTVAEIAVEGTIFTSPDEIRELAALGSESSIWDDPSIWERRVEAHPLVVAASARKSGLRRVTFRIDEVVPVAVAATPRLVPIDGEGQPLAIDPATHMLDLPIVPKPGSDRTVVRCLAELLEARPAVFGTISEARLTSAGDGVELILLEASPAGRMVLPLSDPLLGLRRIEAALSSRPSSDPVLEADARFSGQVVVRPAKPKKEGA
ncbi:MAG: hypothetical protein ABFS14_00250 [Gemmatimonadota bacterium]